MLHLKKQPRRLKAPMISRAEFNEYNKAVQRLVDEASRATSDQIRAWMQINPDASVAECREFAKETMDGMCQVFGEAASSLAAEWYDVEVGKSGKKLPVAVAETTYDSEQVKKVAHYQARNLVDGDIEGFLDRCAEYVENNTKQSLNSTILANVARDKEAGVRFARVTTGAETCSFCFMLSSRGAVYYSRKTAGEQNHYHRRCDCKIVPGFEDDPDAEIVEGYDPKGMRDRMALIEQQTGLTFGNKADMSALSLDMQLRDPNWLTSGITPKVSYSDPTVELKKLSDKDHPAEKRTAEKLSESGFSAVFIDDEQKYIDENSGLEQTIGLTDLASGLEIKNVQTSSSKNTISKHLSNARKKQGFVQVVIDVSENENLSDDEARQYIKLGLKRHNMKCALMINHSYRIETVWA